MSSRASQPRAGFTLIEMMIVVVIIAVLATVAIVAYTRHVRSGRIVAAKAFLSAIQARQEAYFQQWGYYCDISSGYYPSTVPAGDAVGWAAPAAWADLGAKPETGSTYFQFLVRASLTTAHALDSVASNLGIPAQVTSVTPHPWYYVVGRADFDASGCDGTAPNLETSCTIMYSTSARTEIVSRNEGK